MSSVADRPVFLSLVSLVPAELREWPVGAWDIGEQEAALEQLVKAIVDSGTVTSNLDRAQVAVLAERWGCWARLQGALEKCAQDPHAPQAVAVIEGTSEGTRVDAASPARWQPAPCGRDAPPPPGSHAGAATMSPVPGHLQHGRRGPDRAD